MKKRRLKVFALGAALVFFAALLPVTALAVEEEELPASSGGLEDGLHGSAPEDDNFGAPPEFGEPEGGNPTEPALKPETPEGGAESGGSAESAPEPEKPGNGAEGGGSAESAPELKPPEDGEKEDGSPEPAPELPGEGEPPENMIGPETPEGGGETGGPPEEAPPEDAEIGEPPPEGPEAPVAFLSADTQGRITLDGSLEDWAMVPGMDHGNPKIESWKAARDLEGNVYVCYTGTAETPYDTHYKWNPIVVTQDRVTRQAVQDDLAQVFPGAEMAVENLANGQSAAPYYVELMIPAVHVSGEGCVLSLGWAGQPVPVSRGGKKKPTTPPQTMRGERGDD